MSELVEIRWHARGGQGAVTASKLLAESALLEDKYVQAFPEYGAERTGAPIQSFTRLSDRPIDIHSQVTKPDIVLVLDETLIGAVDVTAGLKEGGKIIVNTEEDAEVIKDELGAAEDQPVYTVNANKISREEIGKVIPNTPMIGALIKATSVVNVDKVIDTIEEEFGKKFAPAVLEGNIKAVKRAYDEVKSTAN
ncbi:hypothetical protein LCGC14_1729330 [marine sediment metagenome]|uniref:Pyruvate/ketoisovalerate oxidoreductase catalytic domain-containing protein n=1 Tax=marine sediment metagenome TaxID=412755 RepID=A0A0F9K9S6_9ZZZZ|nr:pyruvate synthase [Actinomycetota bacterium]